MSRLYTSTSGRFTVDLLHGIECLITDQRTGRSLPVTGTSLGMQIARWLEDNCSEIPAVRPPRDDLSARRIKRDRKRPRLRLVGGTLAGRREGDSLIAQLSDHRRSSWPTSPTGGDAA